MSSTLGFYGAARTVTGSRHLLTTGGAKVLIDCGLFQGSRELGERNHAPFPFDPATLDAVVVTHAHMDHVGLLPRLVDEGYTGPIYATPATIGLCRISLPDGGRLQEESAARDARHGKEARPPLSTEAMAFAALERFEPVGYHAPFALPGGATLEFRPAGHILGSAFAQIDLAEGRRLLMGGDLGRVGTPVIRDPERVESADYVVVESTYGDRIHPKEEVIPKLGALVKEAFANGSAIIVPSFSIGRTQELLYYFRELEDAGELPRIPIYLDSPMAVGVTQLYAGAKEEQDDDMLLSVEEGRSSLEPSGVQIVRDREASKALNNAPGPLVIIAGSGMANGGRVVHHLRRRIGDPKTVVLFTGYQAEGTLGRRLLDGADEVSILGEKVPVAARIERLNALSAHADQREILDWLHGFAGVPRRTFIVHGEPGPQEALAGLIEDELGWRTEIPEFGQVFELD